MEVMLERWEAGSSEPPHSHPGDDMTVVIEGKMLIQFFTKTNGELVENGDAVTLSKGDTGYIKAGRIHDAKYIVIDSRRRFQVLCPLDLFTI